MSAQLTSAFSRKAERAMEPGLLEAAATLVMRPVGSGMRISGALVSPVSSATASQPVDRGWRAAAEAFFALPLAEDAFTTRTAQASKKPARQVQSAPTGVPRHDEPLEGLTFYRPEGGWDDLRRPY